MAARAGRPGARALLPGALEAWTRRGPGRLLRPGRRAARQPGFPGRPPRAAGLERGERRSLGRARGRAGAALRLGHCAAPAAALPAALVLLGLVPPASWNSV